MCTTPIVSQADLEQRILTDKGVDVKELTALRQKVQGAQATQQATQQMAEQALAHLERELDRTKQLRAQIGELQQQLAADKASKAANPQAGPAAAQASQAAPPASQGPLQRAAPRKPAPKFRKLPATARPGAVEDDDRSGYYGASRHDRPLVEIQMADGGGDYHHMRQASADYEHKMQQIAEEFEMNDRKQAAAQELQRVQDRLIREMREKEELRRAYQSQRESNAQMQVRRAIQMLVAPSPCVSEIAMFLVS